jgi:hypothetical protein
MIQARRQAGAMRPPFNASGVKRDPAAIMIAERQGKHA